jgi:TonB family protein
MKAAIIFFCIGILIGCSSTKLTERTTSLPILLEQTELPPVPESIYRPSFRIMIKMQIDENGRVLQARLIEGSGESDWDSLAVQSIRKWKFDPAQFENRPVRMWIVQSARVQIADPHYLSLAEIICDTYDQAITVVAKLQEGKDFGELAALYSTDSSKNQKGIIGKMDIHLLPQKINRVLKNLDIGEYTQPMEYGKRFAIFKRMENGH